MHAEAGGLLRDRGGAAEVAAAGVAAGVAAAAAAAADMARRALLRRWYEAEGLVPLAASTVPPAAEAPAIKGGARCPCRRWRFLLREHGSMPCRLREARARLRLVRLSVRNGAAWPCAHLCGTMLPRGGISRAAAPAVGDDQLSVERVSAALALLRLTFQA